MPGFSETHANLNSASTPIATAKTKSYCASSCFAKPVHCSISVRSHWIGLVVTLLAEEQRHQSLDAGC